MKFSNLSNHIVVELGVRNGLSPSHGLGMLPCSVLLTDGTTSSLDHVSHIVFVCSLDQVIRTHAGTTITGVPDNLFIHQWTDVQSIRHTMSVFPRLIMCDHGVTVRLDVSTSTGPGPASIGIGRLGYRLPEYFFQWPDIRHSVALLRAVEIRSVCSPTESYVADLAMEVRHQAGPIVQATGHGAESVRLTTRLFEGGATLLTDGVVCLTGLERSGALVPTKLIAGSSHLESSRTVLTDGALQLSTLDRAELRCPATPRELNPTLLASHDGRGLIQDSSSGMTLGQVILKAVYQRKLSMSDNIAGAL